MSTKSLHPGELRCAIQCIELRKKAANVIPAHALRSELASELNKYPASEIEALIDEMEADGRLERGRTINDTYIKIG